MPEQSRSTKNMLKLADDLLEKRRAAMRSTVIPLGEEKLTPAETAQRMKHDQALRMQVIQPLPGETPEARYKRVAALMRRMED